MTHDQIKAAIKGHCNLTSDEADSRVGDSVNRHYRRITSLLGMDATRFVTRSAVTTVGVRTVEFLEIEKIDRLLDTTASESIRMLPEVSVHYQRSTQPTSGAPCSWAFQGVGHASVIVLLDVIPQVAYSLQADGWTSLADLQGDDVPAFPESFHDVLVWAVIAEELWRKEKPQLATAYEAKAEKLIGELRFYLADTYTRDTRQADHLLSPSHGAGVGGGPSVTLGATSYTQSGLITFDRGAGLAPFAVAQTTAAVVPNLDSDKLDGQHGSYYLNRANHIGTTSTAVTDIAPVTTDRVLGRDTAGSGVAEQLTVGGGIEFTGTGGLQRSALTGDVTAPAGSNATSIGALSISSAKLADNSVTNAKLRDSVNCSVIGRSVNSSGDPADISASTDHMVLARFGNVLQWLSGFAFDGLGRILWVIFAATQNPSSDPNTLDDYREGNWTPTDVSGAGLAFTTVEGSYVKVGQLVTVAGLLSYPATANTATAIIGGLPLTVQNTTNDLWVGAIFNTSGTTIGGVLIHNTTTIQPRNLATFSTFTNANLSGLQLRFTFSYRATE